MPTPRLHLTTESNSGKNAHIGTFSDSPKGRAEAQEAEKAAWERNAFLIQRIENDPSNKYRPRNVEHPDTRLLTKVVHIDRSFGRHHLEELARIPSLGDARPKSLLEAQEYELQRVEAFYRRKDCGSSPLTPYEAIAHGLACVDQKRALELASSLGARQLATTRAGTLNALLPKVTEAKADSSADEWHPGMTDPVISTNQVTESASEQIQVRTRSQGLRF